MLLLINKWALRLLPLYRISLIVALAGSLLSTGLLLASGSAEAFAIRLSLLLTMWALTLFVFINLFRKPIPFMLPALSWLDRVMIRLQIAFHYGMTVAYVVLLLVVLNLSAKLLMPGLRA